MRSIRASDFIGLYQRQVEFIDKIWWYFYSVTIVMLSFITISDTIMKNKSEVLTIVVGYLAFSIGCAIILKNGQNNLHLFARQAHNLNSDINLSVCSTRAVVTFQITIAVAVVVSTLAILFLKT